MRFRVRLASFPGDLPAVQDLFTAYQAELGVDLSFQSFGAEVASLPGSYAPPGGLVLCLEMDRRVAGCVAMRQLPEGAAEMKRLFVAPTARGHGAARALVVELIARAREMGYRRMYLDTLPGMAPAQRLYESLGFCDVDAYTHNPIAGTRFMALELGREDASR